LHKKAKTLLENLTDEIKQIKLKIDKPVKDIDSLGGVMQALEEIRQKQSEIALQFKPINDMYSLIDNYFSNIMDKDEIDSKTAMQNNWETLVGRSENIRNDLQEQNADFKMSLIKGIKALVIDVKEFRHNFDTKGPTVPGLEPREALNRLRMFGDEYSIRKRKFDSYFAGETLFGLPHTQYPLLVKTANEIELLDKLYGLYSKVKDTIAKWREIPWVDIQTDIEKMIEIIEGFARDCTKLPGSLKQWDAYKELKQEIDDMSEILPLVTALAKPSIRDRHWDEVIELVKEEIPYQSETFQLQHLFKCPLLKFREEIEEITESADKQLKLEKTLKEEIILFWEDAELQIKTWKGVDQPCTLGGNIQDIQEKLEEHLNQLNQMNAMKYVTPFKTEVTDRIALLSDVADVIEKWLKVQTLWTNLVSVFTSGDIARNLPTEAKLFKTIDKIWLKNMERAFETKNVIQCCQNELLKSSLGQM
jgi:dynein heavy chain